MNRLIKVASLFVVVAALIFSIQTDGFAKGGKGHSEGNEKGKSTEKVEKVDVISHGDTTTVITTKSKPGKARPYGWDQGKKTGWHGGKYPPGWTKWNHEEQKKWVTDREEAYTEINHFIGQYNIPIQTADQIRGGFDEAILGGMMITDATKKLVNGLKDGNQRKLFMINSTQTVLDYLK